MLHTQNPQNPSLSRFEVFSNARQHAQPLSSDTHSSQLVPQSYFTTGLDTASLPSSDAETALFSGNLLSEVLRPTSVRPHIRLPEYYTAEHSRPPTTNFSDFSIRIDCITIYDSKHDPLFPIHTERFITTNKLLSKKRKKNRT